MLIGTHSTSRDAEDSVLNKSTRRPFSTNNNDPTFVQVAATVDSSVNVDIDAQPDLDFDVAPEDFDEVAYLAAYPDVSQAIVSGQCESALNHYYAHGQRESRLDTLTYRRAWVSSNTATFPAGNIDALYGSDTGRCLIFGWINDSERTPISQLALSSTQGLWGTTRTFARCRRPDVENALEITGDRHFGFWASILVESPATLCGEIDVVVAVGDERKTYRSRIQPVSNKRLQEIAFEYLAGAQYLGDAWGGAFTQLDTGIGNSLIDVSAQLAQDVARGGYQVRFGPSRSAWDGSVIVCLFGRVEFLSLQASLFSRCAGSNRYEYIYVCNSPELSERLIKDATIAARIYDISLTLIILPGNAGFGMANNVAVNAARSGRILIVNPDVLPRDPAWPDHHTQLVQSLPFHQAAIFGVPLFYDDGSLMHGGMYFDMDVGLSVEGGRMSARDMLRVEHYGKGAPPENREYRASRPVSAVSGAFISVDRSWFETLGGFSPEYVFGHYEDADLCLKSLQAGNPVWMHDLPFWHFEGKGSDRRLAHEGGSIINRWHFTRTWGDFVTTNLLGKAPPGLIQNQAMKIGSTLGIPS